MLKYVILYVVMVGIPVATLPFILKLGADVQAAPNVEGRWSVEGPSCVAGAEILLEHQSGRYLSTHGELAHINDNLLEANWIINSGPCEGEHASLLLTPDEARETLSGTFTVDCSACDSEELVATRLSRREISAEPSAH